MSEINKNMKESTSERSGKGNMPNAINVNVNGKKWNDKSLKINSMK